MAIIAEAVKHLIAAGVTGDALVMAISDMEESLKPQKTSAAIRQQRYRDRNALRNVSNVTPLPLDGSDGSDGFPCTPSLTSLTSLNPIKENPPKGGQKKNPHSAPIELPEWLPLPEWQDFKEMRDKIKKSMTQRAEKLAIDKLDEFRLNGHDPTKILNQSILNNYQDLYEPKENNHENAGRINGKHSGNETRNQSTAEPPKSKWIAEGDRLAAKYRAEAQREREGEFKPSAG